MVNSHAVEYLNRGISRENLSVKETQGNIWNYYELMEEIGVGSISTIYLVKAKRNRKTIWKRWIKDIESTSAKHLDKFGFSKEFHKIGFSSTTRQSFNRFINTTLPPLLCGRHFMICGDRRMVCGPHHDIDMLNDRVFALKAIQLHRVNNSLIETLKTEIDALKSLDHPNIVKLYETFEIPQRKQLFMVMEICSGGDLWNHVPCTEKEAARVISQVLAAVAYMHDNGIIHRDLKLENIMLENNSPDASVKIIDFGLSTKFLPSKGDPLTARVGTVYTMAPEVVKKEQYTFKADMWSVGVITYVLLGDFLPFFSQNRHDLLHLISVGKYDFIPENNWNKVSQAAKDFVSDLLEYDPSERLSALQAMNHPWIRAQSSPSEWCPTLTSDLEEISTKLLTKKPCSGVKKLALYTIARRATAKEVREIRRLFSHFNTSKNGSISFEEFRAVLSHKCTEDELQSLFNMLSFNSNSGHLNYTDFIAALIDTREYMDENRLAETFRILDYDDTGYITIKHLRHFLTEHYNDTDIQRILDEADVNHDGQVTFEDFLELFKEKEPQDEISKENDPLLQIQLQNNNTDNTEEQLLEFLTPCKENKKPEQQQQQPEDDDDDDDDDDNNNNDLDGSKNFDVFELFNEKDRDDIKKDLLKNEFFA